MHNKYDKNKKARLLIVSQRDTTHFHYLCNSFQMLVEEGVHFPISPNASNIDSIVCILYCILKLRWRQKSKHCHEKILW